MTFTTTFEFRSIYLEYVDFKSEISELSAHLNYFLPSCLLSLKQNGPTMQSQNCSWGSAEFSYTSYPAGEARIVNM